WACAPPCCRTPCSRWRSASPGGRWRRWACSAPGLCSVWCSLRYCSAGWRAGSAEPRSRRRGRRRCSVSEKAGAAEGRAENGRARGGRAGAAPAERIYNRIAVMRVERGVSRRSLAEALGVHYQTVGYLERGEYSPSLHLALRIAGYFGVPVEAVFSTEPFPLIGHDER